MRLVQIAASAAGGGTGSRSGAAGLDCGIAFRKRAYAADTSAPYSRMMADRYTHSRNAITVPTDPCTLNRDMSRRYQENNANAPRHSKPARSAPTHTSLSRTLALGA